MARPTKQGVDYFPMECHFDGDIKMFIAEKGACGLGLLVTVWRMIYSGKGYYILDDDDLPILLKHETGLPVDDIINCIQVCLRRGIFDKRLNDEHKILTSEYIQRAYFIAAKKKKTVYVDGNYIMSGITVGDNSVSAVGNATEGEGEGEGEGEVEVKGEGEEENQTPNPVFQNLNPNQNQNPVIRNKYKAIIKQDKKDREIHRRDKPDSEKPISKKTNPNSKNIYPAEFETTWAVYPRRNSPSNKASGFKAWRARINEGHKAKSIHEGVKNYAKFCEKEGILTTEFVKQASTFFGPNCHFEDYQKPAKTLNYWDTWSRQACSEAGLPMPKQPPPIKSDGRVH